jgi:hypothetical protein
MAFSQSHTTTFSLQRERGRGHSPLPNVHIFNTATQDRLTYSAEGASGADALRDAETAYETELLRVIASQDGGYWFSDERRWSSNTDWAPIRSIFMALYRVTANLRIWIKLYGLTGGLAVAFFGKSDVWKKQVQVLGSFRPPPALEFKKIIEKESSTVGISVRLWTLASELRRITCHVGRHHHSSGIHRTQSAKFDSNSLGIARFLHIQSFICSFGCVLCR